MSVMRLPTGLSVTQAKKDAKKLARKERIKQSEALDLIAFENGRANWPELTNQLDTQNRLFARLNRGPDAGTILDLPESKSVTIVSGFAGSGKSCVLREFSAQWLDKKYPIVYLGYNEDELNTLTAKYPALFRFIDLDKIQSDQDVADLKLNGAILMIDEYHWFRLYKMQKAIQDLIRASMHTFISTQTLDEIEPLVDNGIKNVSAKLFSFILMPGSQAGITKLKSKPTKPEVELILRELKYVPGEFSEFVWLNANETRKFKFSPVKP